MKHSSIHKLISLKRAIFCLALLLVTASTASAQAQEGIPEVFNMVPSAVFGENNPVFLQGGAASHIPPIRYGDSQLYSYGLVQKALQNAWLERVALNVNHSSNISKEAFVAFTSCAAVDIPEAECTALVNLYTDTIGGSWNNNSDWLVTDQVCTWYGVSCSGSHVVGLYLYWNNLTGSLSTDLTPLTNLSIFNAMGNNLSGDFSTALGNLPTGLVELNLHYNNFTGTIPSSISSFSSLSSLGLSSSSLAGDLSFIADLPTSLTKLWLDYNDFTGTIPADISSLTSLTELNLAGNLLVGDMAVVIGNIPTSMEFLELQGNDFTGTIPVDVGDLTGLTYLSLGVNQLSGDLATVIGYLPANLEQLYLYANDFTGTIPSSIGDLTALRFLSLGNNQLTGDLSTIIGYMPASLEFLSLPNNGFTGTIPASVAGLTNLFCLDLAMNQITGDLSTIIGYLPTAMSSLILNDNMFSGTIPDSISALTALSNLILSGNSAMAGTISMNITLLNPSNVNFAGTGLCEPDDLAYDTWVATVYYYAPGTCLSFLFADDFETGDLSQWSSFNDGGGFLYACAQAAMNGSYGACVEKGSNNNRKQLIDTTPNNETVFNARFNFDVNSLSMGLGDPVRIMQFKMGSERPAFLVLQRFSDGYYIQLNVKEDDLSKSKTGWVLLSDAPHTIEVDWAAATSDGANDGYITLYVDDVEQDSLTGLDNDTFNITSFRMGFTSRLAGKAISGIFYVDDVATGNTGYIGVP